MNFTNILGTISAIITIVLGIMANVLGCTVPEGAEVATCTASWLSPAWAGVAMVAFAVLTIASKLFRAGGPLRGLFGSTAVIVPPDSSKSGVGTVTPAQVATPTAK